MPEVFDYDIGSPEISPITLDGEIVGSFLTSQIKMSTDLSRELISPCLNIWPLKSLCAFLMLQLMNNSDILHFMIL
jgi:hypothetical protein